MKRILFALLALAINLAAVPLAAQNPAGPPQGPPAAAPVPPSAETPAVPPLGRPAAAGEVRGVIVAADSSNTPVARPAVGVRTKSDGKLVAGGYGGEDGTFRIQGLTPGTYYLRVSGIGFTPLNTPEFTIDPAAPTANVGSIKLARVSVTLQSVQIPA